MDTKRGVFVDEPQFQKLTTDEQDRVSKCATLAVGEIVTVKDARFKVTEILSRGRVKMKMIAEG